MAPALPLLSLVLWAAPAFESLLVQVAPPVPSGQPPRRSPHAERAVILLHGLLIHPFSKTNVARAELHSWQKPDSTLVTRLAREADVFSFAYAQTVPAEEVADRPDLAEYLAQVRQLGYREIILLGHSAGGLIARTFVEDHPDAGVTKVIQVCSPNGGSGWATIQAVRANQLDFLDSLTKAARRRAGRQRADKTIPAHVEFVCVVGTGAAIGDGLVHLRCQWPEDLQGQGVPAASLPVTHWTAVRSARGAELAARLVRERQPRWDAAHVAAARKKLLGP
jgi:pimeloyl-ACP methyl ester carboxylesterase